MKKIVDYKTLEESGLPTVKKRIIGTYLNRLTALYNITSIESIGAIYCLEREEELSDFHSFGMYEPISSDNISRSSLKSSAMSRSAGASPSPPCWAP